VKDLSTESSSTGLSESVGWSSVPFYVVGKATASALNDISTTYGDSPFVPRDIRGGSESGTSERLAHFILDDFTRQGNANPTLLYLTGDKYRDNLHKILKEGGFELGVLQVYGTHGSSSFASDLERAIKSISADRWWIVFFAPSAAEFAVPVLLKFFDLLPSDLTGGQPSPGPRVAAIGQTTATFLRENLNLRVDVVPSKPTPEDIVEAVLQYDGINPSPIFSFLRSR